MSKKSIFKQMGEAVLRDWEFDKESESPPEPTKFDSMYTNIFGERWWCRRTEDQKGMPQLVVWGDDVDIAISRRGSSIEFYPWVMHEGEQLWLRANLWRLKQDEDLLASKRAHAAEGTPAP